MTVRYKLLLENIVAHTEEPDAFHDLQTALAAVSSSWYLTVTNSYMYSTTCLP